MGRGEGIELEATTYCKAPELLKSGMFTTATDIYALGMVMYEILFRREPFAGEPTEVSYHPTRKHSIAQHRTALHNLACQLGLEIWFRPYGVL